LLLYRLSPEAGDIPRRTQPTRATVMILNIFPLPT